MVKELMSSSYLFIRFTLPHNLKFSAKDFFFEKVVISYNTRTVCYCSDMSSLNNAREVNEQSPYFVEINILESSN